MSKYIIVSKDIVGNDIGCRYNIEYQIVGDANIHNLYLYCVRKDENGNYIYGFDSCCSTYGIETSQDRYVFLQEFYEFQKGGSYRIKHPIQQSEYDMLCKQLEQYKQQIKELETTIADVKKLQTQARFENYYNNVNMKEIDDYINLIDLAINSNNRYTISNIEWHIWDGSRAVLYDNILNKPVKMIQFENMHITARDLSLDELDVKYSQ